MPEQRAHESLSGPTQKQRAVRIAVVVVIVLAIALGIFLATRPAADETQVAPTTAPPTAPATTIDPTPTEWPTPVPGATDPAPPSQDVIEVGIDEPADIEGRLTAEVVSLESVEGEGQGPGEVSGPAVRVSVRLVNDSAEEIDLRSAVVNLEYSDDLSPANPISGPGAEPFPDVLPPGESAQGTFVFSVPLDGRALVRATLDLSATAPMVVFVGVGPN